MTPEAIVRALAAADPTAPISDIGPWECALCRATNPEPAADHEPDCPWRLAVEWVAAREALHTFDLAPDSRAAEEFPTRLQVTPEGFTDEHGRQYEPRPSEHGTGGEER